MCIKIKILLVEHNPDDLELIQYELKHGGIDFVADIVQNEQEYVKSISEFIPDIILSDYSLPLFHGSKAFNIREEIAPGTPFIFVSGSIGEEKSIEYIRNGVTDYVLKDKLFTLTVKVKRALKETKEKQVTNKTATELALSESLLARAQQLAQLGSWELNFTDNVLTLSAEGCRIFGFDPGQNRLSTETWRSLIHPDDTENVLHDINAAMDSLQDTTYQHRIVLQDGTIRHINSESKFEFDLNGNATGMYGTMQDVTERINAEEMQEFEKTNNEALINSTDDLIWSVSNDFKLIAANKAFIKGLETMWGIRIKTGDNPLMKDIFSGDKLVFWELIYKKVLSGESLKEEVYTPAFNNWKESWADIRFNPVYKGDTVVAIACYSRNITESKLAEKKINESEHRYRSLVEQATDAICITDASMKFIDINPYALGMFGYTQEEALQLSLPDILFAEDLVINPIKLSELKLGKTTRNERRLKRKDGTAVDMAVSTKLMEDGRLIMFGHDITERKKSEESLRESEMRLRQIIDLVPHFIFAKDGKGKFVLANEAVAQAYGCTVKDLIGKTDADFNSKKEEIEYFLEEDLKVINSGNIKYNIEETITDSTGNTRILSTTKIPYTSSGLVTPGVLGVSVDISESKKAETILKENEGQLSIVAQIAKLGYWEFDVTKNLFKFNDQFYSIFKATAEGVGGYTISSERYLTLFVHPDDYSIVANLAANAIKSPDPYYNGQIEHRIIYADGSVGYMAVRFFTMKNELGRTIKTYGAIQDITEKKNAEAVLRKRERQLSIATQIAKLGYWELDIVNNLFTFTDQFYTIFKTTAEKEGGYTMTPDRYTELFVHPDDRGIVGQQVAKAIHSADPSISYHIEHRIVYATGEIGHISVCFYIVKDEDGRTIKTFGVNQDITDRKKGEETLLKSEAILGIKNKQLEQKNKELEQFAFVASHDMQEPLRTTSSFAELLQKQYKGRLDEKADKYLSFIIQSSYRMKALIKDLLDYSRIGRKTELVGVDCNILLQEVRADLGCAIKETGAEIEADHLPVINGYPTEVKQLFQNLVTNAIKFRKQNTVPYINIGVQQKGSYWEFTFKDNGIGIKEQHMERIFIIFQRLHTRNQYEGSGIGLAHCKKIVELHGGKIWIESTPGEGSTVHFTISQNSN